MPPGAMTHRVWPVEGELRLCKSSTPVSAHVSTLHVGEPSPGADVGRGAPYSSRRALWHGSQPLWFPLSQVPLSVVPLSPVPLSMFFAQMW